MGIRSFLKRAHVVAEGLGRSDERSAAHEYIRSIEDFEANAEDAGGATVYDRIRREKHEKLAAALKVNRDTAHRTLFGR